MKKTSEQFIDLLFNDGETVCVSNSKYGYHSVDQDDLKSNITLISPSDKVSDFNIKESDINLIALNPISGFRVDKNATAYRSFLVELDDGDLLSQMEYIREMEMPYSVCVFSGNKSLHFGIVLEKDLENSSLWRTLNQWILNIMTKADQQTKNPSRSIRFPNNIRKDGKKLNQGLVEMKGRVKNDDVIEWVNRWPELKPKPKNNPYANMDRIEIPSDYDVPDWLLEKLQDGVVSTRNSNWYYYSMKMAQKGFDIGQIVTFFEKFYREESDFNRKEWLQTLENGYNAITD